MIQGQELELALGLPVDITSFNDNLPRMCYPFTLETLKRANIYLSNFDNEDLFKALEEESSQVALSYFLKESFRDNDISELFNVIDVNCFKELINDIKFISGIIDGKGEKNLDSEDTLNWQKSINVLQAYTSNTFKEIKDMTLIQFNSLLSYVGIVINWDYKTKTVCNVAEPKDYIGKEEHPLAGDSKVEHKKFMTMKDIGNLTKL